MISRVNGGQNTLFPFVQNQLVEKQKHGFLLQKCLGTLELKQMPFFMFVANSKCLKDTNIVVKGIKSCFLKEKEESLNDSLLTLAVTSRQHVKNC